MNREDIAASFDLTGRVAIVTGGTRGIGLAIAEGLAAQGAKVVVASRKADACTTTQAALEAAGHEALGVPTHMGDLESLDALVAATVDRFGGIDIVINNAANALALPLPDITEEAWAKAMDVNLRGPVFLVQKCLPHLMASDQAAVVNVLTAGAYMHTPDQLMYGAAKNAMLSVTRSLAAKYAPGIRVNAIAPGTVDTDMTRNTGELSFEHMKGISPMGRMAEPSEMVGAVLLLVSGAGSYITGQSLLVDGGLVPSR